MDTLSLGGGILAIWSRGGSRHGYVLRDYKVCKIEDSSFISGVMHYPNRPFSDGLRVHIPLNEIECMYEYETKEAWEERNKLRPRKRKKWRLFHKTSMILFLLGLLLGLGLISGCAPPAGEWWFSTVAPAERERQYHIGFAFDSPSLHIEDHDECTVTVIMEPTPDAQGLTWRIIDAPEQCDTSSTLGLWMWWIQLMQNAKERGTGVTATEVHFGDWPLLAGPLRKGDRMQMTFGMFAIFSVRAEVLSADAEEVAVRFDFVGAWAAYRWKGSGDLNMAVDDEGLREVRGSWGGTFGTHDFDARLTIDRLP